jgi:GxxExxY protein
LREIYEEGSGLSGRECRLGVWMALPVYLTTKRTKGTKMTEEEVAREIVEAALAVHRALGPGLLESAYEQCLVLELKRRGVAVERQKDVPIIYQGMRIDAGYRIDLLVGGSVIVELKAVDRLGRCMTPSSCPT